MRELGLIGVTFMLVDAFLAGADVGGSGVTARERLALQRLFDGADGCDGWPVIRGRAAGIWLDSLFGDDDPIPYKLVAIPGGVR